MKSIWKTILIAALTLIIGVVIGKFLLGSHQGNQADEPVHSEHADEAKEQIWTCAMHPQIRQNEPGDCPICGMELVPVADAPELGATMFAMSEAAVQLANIQTSTVEPGNAERTIRLQGKVQADERNISLVTARFGGRLDKLEINFTGAEVKKGDRLASIYSPQLITAQRELLEAVKVKETTPQLYNAAKNKLKLWNLSNEQIASIEQGGEPLEHIDIFSPVSGIVTNRTATLGEYVKEGAVLFHVTDLSKVWVLFDAYEGDLSFIKKNAPISFTVASVPNKKFKSKVTFVDPVLDPKTRTASVRVEVDNPDWKLKPEMFASGVITLAPTGKDELMVPRSAVMWTGKRSVVYVKVPEASVPTFEFREVSLGSELNGSYEITEGLQQGDEVVTNGTFKVDAAAQLAGKKSMMNRTGGKVSMGGHAGMDMGGKKGASTKDTEMPDMKNQVMVDKSKIPEAFKLQLGEAVAAYLPIKDKLASDDKDLKKEILQFKKSLKAVDMNLVMEDAHNTWMKELKSMNKDLNLLDGVISIDEQRSIFQRISNSLMNAVSTLGVKPQNKSPIYLQFCPMVNDNAGGYWFSKDEEIRNPYFGAKMLKCGSTKETYK